MTFGKKLKMIRNTRKLTLKELGIAVGFSEDTADVRIAQYESSRRTPKSDVLIKIAKALKVSVSALKKKENGSIEDMLHTLFWLEEDFVIYTHTEHAYLNVNSIFKMDATTLADVIKADCIRLREKIAKWTQAQEETFLDKNNSRADYFKWKLDYFYQIE